MNEVLPFGFPFDSQIVARKKRRWIRELKNRDGLIKKKIAIFGGSSTQDLKSFLELFLLQEGFAVEFYESSYDRYQEEALFPDDELLNFNPDLCYVYVTSHNLPKPLGLNSSLKELEEQMNGELRKYHQIWAALRKHFTCEILQNNFEAPALRPLGHLEVLHPQGRVQFITQVNVQLQRNVYEISDVHLFDWNYCAQWHGLENWHSDLHWHRYKYALHPDCLPKVCYELSKKIVSLWRHSKKVLVTDLDDTLYGGVISEDGMAIELGPGSARGEAFLAIQNYLLRLKERGIILGIISKNDLAVARQLFDHPHCLLKETDFASIYANWKPKSENLIQMANDLNLGLDAFVFLDNSEFERDEVCRSLPQVAVPNIGDCPEDYPRRLDQACYFETSILSNDDLKRDVQYQAKKAFDAAASETVDYESFLKSLNMEGRILVFSKENIPRIHQLINKTNQFNLRTQRLQLKECEDLMESSHHICLTGELRDRHGEHGIVAVLVASIEDESAQIDHFLMSCRVLKRNMEHFMLEHLVALLKNRGVTRLVGNYIRTPKNALVSKIFHDFGFTLKEKKNNGDSVWDTDLTVHTLNVLHQIKKEHE
jgi:FkbH-like protein